MFKQNNALKLIEYVVAFDCLRTIGLSILMLLSTFQYYYYGVPTETLNKGLRFSISSDQQALILIYYSLLISVLYFSAAILIVSGIKKAIIAFVCTRLACLAFNYIFYSTQIKVSTIAGLILNIFFISVLLIFYVKSGVLRISPVFVAIPIIISFSYIYLHSDLAHYKNKMILCLSKNYKNEICLREEMISDLSENKVLVPFYNFNNEMTSITQIDVCQEYLKYYRRNKFTTKEICSPLSSSSFYMMNCNDIVSKYSPKYIYPKNKDILDDLQVCKETREKRWKNR